MSETKLEIREAIAEDIFNWYQRQFNLSPKLKWESVSGGLRGLILSITDIVFEHLDSLDVARVIRGKSPRTNKVERLI